MKKLIKEPFLHFLILGAALFALYQQVGNKSEQPNKSIIISENDINFAIDAWEQRWNRSPSDSELNEVLEQQVRLEVFYREALALDLGKNDPVIRRRLAEKMIFIANNLLVPKEASDQQLLDFMGRYPDKFHKSQLISFKQIYFNPDLNTESLLNEIDEIKFKLNSNKLDTLDAMIGDDFNGDFEYKRLPMHQAERYFGLRFVARLERLPVDSWVGPIESGYGLHLVNIIDRTAIELMPLESIKDKVLLEWQAEQQRKSTDSLYAKLRETYKVVFEMPTNERE